MARTVETPPETATDNWQALLAEAKPLPARLCRRCGTSFKVARPGQVFCATSCGKPATRHTARTKKRDQRRAEPTPFVGVDGEGIQGPCETVGCDCRAFQGDKRCVACRHTRNEHRHVYVMLGVGDQQIENPDGLHYIEIFRHLYDCYEKDPHAAYVGFFLGYDFTHWLRSLPGDKAWLLLTEKGKRKRTLTKGKKPYTAPVRLNEDRIGTGEAWEVEWLAGRRLSIRPMLCACDLTPGKRCKHRKPPYMHICDAGPYFQTSFLNVIDPDRWPEPVCSPAEYDLIAAGKAARAGAGLDNDMRRYNALENEVFARVMGSFDTGLRARGIQLGHGEWYGPGSAAAKWMQLHKVPRRDAIEKALPDGVGSAATGAYFGGWFEVMAHGHVPGVTYEYDINSAYPHVIATLPCLLHGRWELWERRNRRKLPPVPDGAIRLVHAQVTGTDPNIGSMLHRAPDHRIARPAATAGWYWSHELASAVAAGLINTIDADQAWTYQPCGSRPPLRKVRELYTHRLEVGKNTPEGKASKLVMNSLYGKMAQGLGARPFANYLYAGLITAGCRTMILDAIATHPQRSAAVVMVATDAVYFTSPHPTLRLSASELGSWDKAEHTNLCVFKPGVYWHDKARDAISAGDRPIFKARGINAKAFAGRIPEVDQAFRAIADTQASPAEWPTITYTSDFAMVTAKMALHRHKWGTAGAVSDQTFTHTASPSHKRCSPHFDGDLLRTRPFAKFGPKLESTGYIPHQIETEIAEALGGDEPDTDTDEYLSPDGPLGAIAFGQLGTGQWAG